MRKKIKAYGKLAVAEGDLKDSYGKENHQKFSKWIKMHNVISTCRLLFKRTGFSYAPALGRSLIKSKFCH